MNRSDIAVPLLIPVVTALLGALGIVARDLYERRTERGRRKRAYDDATRRVAFATEWWKAKQELGVEADSLQSARETAQKWLREATTLIDQSVQPPRRPESQYSVTRRVLLAYPFKSASARLLRVVYYFMLLLMVFAVSIAIVPIEGVSGLEQFAGMLWVLVLYGLPVLGTRAWAVSIEQRAARRPARVSTPTWNVANDLPSAPQSFPPGRTPKGRVWPTGDAAWATGAIRSTAIWWIRVATAWLNPGARGPWSG